MHGTARRLCVVGAGTLDRMDRPTTPLAPTVAELGVGLRRGLSILKQRGYWAVQLGASGPQGLRPSTLGESARRDLASTLRRAEIQVAGLDLWIPPAHFQDASTVSRATDAVVAAIELCGDLGKCGLTVSIPEDGLDEALLPFLRTQADSRGVPVALAGVQPSKVAEGFRVCVDPPSWFGWSLDPIASVADPSAMPRLADLVAGTRAAPGVGGQLDVEAYRVACEIGLRTARLWRMYGPSRSRWRRWIGCSGCGTERSVHSPHASPRSWCRPRRDSAHHAHA